MDRHYLKPLNIPNKRLITNNTRKIKNKTFAIDAAPAAIPPKPNNAAINAMIRNIITSRNIILSFSL